MLYAGGINIGEGGGRDEVGLIKEGGEGEEGGGKEEDGELVEK